MTKVGFSLSGGGLGCLAYASFLDTLKFEYNLYPHMLAGLSGGAMVAPFISAGLGKDAIFEALSHLTFKKVINHHLHHFELLDHHRFAELFRELLPIKKFEDLPVPVLIFASDVKSRAPEILESGDIASAITASCSVYPFMNPIKRIGKLLTDGGYTTYYGANFLRDRHIKKVIGLDVTGVSEGNVPPILASFYKSVNAAITNHTRSELQNFPVDLDIRIDVQSPTVFDLREKKDHVFKLGEEKAHEYIRHIKKVYEEAAQH